MRWLPILLLVSCERAPPEDDPVLATIGEQAIRRSEVERGVAMEIYQRRLDIQSLLEGELDRIIEERLLEEEAKRRGVDVETLLEGVVSTATVAASEIDEYLALHGQPAERRERVRAYLLGRARIERKLRLVEELRREAGVTVSLEAPVPPRIEVDVSGAPSRGPEDAPVTVVHFGSFTDPRSRRLVPVLASLWRAHPGQIRWVHRHALRPADELGLDAALLSLLAHRKERFWPVHDALFDEGGPLSQALLQRVAIDHGFDPSMIEAARNDPEHLIELKRELDVARRSGVRAPPVLFVNGSWFHGSFGERELASAIERELARGRSPVR